MNIWAIADIHLAISCPDKTMEDFGPQWNHYMDKMAASWKESVNEGDLVLIPGDISWARTLEDAKIDLEWLENLPGKKIMIRGNHDSWWQSKNKVKSILPPSVIALQNDAYSHKGVSIGGARLWDTSEYSNAKIVEYKENPKANPKTPVLTLQECDTLYDKEIHRLKISLDAMDKGAPLKIVLTHYPPLSWDLKSSRVHELLKEYQINICLFGHLHNLIPNPPPLFGEKEGISYQFVAADYLDFKIKKIV